MTRIRLIVSVTAFLVAIVLGTGTVALIRRANAAVVQDSASDRIIRPPKPYSTFQMEVLVNGRPVQEYFGRGRT